MHKVNEKEIVLIEIKMKIEEYSPIDLFLSK